MITHINPSFKCNCLKFSERDKTHTLKSSPNHSFIYVKLYQTVLHWCTFGRTWFCSSQFVHYDDDDFKPDIWQCCTCYIWKNSELGWVHHDGDEKCSCVDDCDDEKNMMTKNKLGHQIGEERRTDRSKKTSSGLKSWKVEVKVVLAGEKHLVLSTWNLHFSPTSCQTLIWNPYQLQGLQGLKYATHFSP